MAKPRWIDTDEQARKAERVLSMLAHKIKKGTATPEEAERYRVGCLDVVVYDWGTESYQNYIPAREAAQKRDEGVIARLLPDAPATEAPPERRVLPPLKKRAG